MPPLLEIPGLFYRYFDTDPWPLENVNLRVEPASPLSSPAARALCPKLSILVLDEATSHFGLPAERQIAQTLGTLQLTVFGIIDHGRFDSHQLRRADCVASSIPGDRAHLH